MENLALQEALDEANDNSRDLGRRYWKFFRRPVSITQTSSGQAATTTKAFTTEASDGTVSTSGSFEIVQAVNVVYELR